MSIFDDGKKLLANQIGKNYIFGHEIKMTDLDPVAFDCSELVQWAFYHLGHVVPDGSWNQYNASVEVMIPNCLDLGFYAKDGKVHHVGIVYDENLVIHAKGKMSGVVVESRLKFQEHSHFVGWRRPKCLMES